MKQQIEMKLDEMIVRLLGVVAVRGLPQNQQIAILSRIGLTPKVISDIIGISANAVRVALFAIRKAERQGKRPGLIREES
jgi:hypothetical protein